MINSNVQRKYEKMLDTEVLNKMLDDIVNGPKSIVNGPKSIVNGPKSTELLVGYIQNHINKICEHDLRGPELDRYFKDNWSKKESKEESVLILLNAQPDLFDHNKLLPLWKNLFDIFVDRDCDKYTISWLVGHYALRTIAVMIKSHQDLSTHFDTFRLKWKTGEELVLGDLMRKLISGGQVGEWGLTYHMTLTEHDVYASGLKKLV